MSAPPSDPVWARFVENPDDAALFEQLEEQLFMAGEWDRLCDLYRRRQAAPGLADRAGDRARIALRLAQVLEDRLEDLEAAIQVYTEAVQLDPRQGKPLLALRRIYSARRSWEMVLQIGEQQASLAESAPDRARIFSEMGDVWLREVGDREQAEALYARARSELGGPEPGAQPADEGSEASLVQSAWVAAARGDTDAALAELERALAHNPASIEALDMRLTVLEGAERHADMAELLERRASLAADPETRGAVLMRLGQICEQLGDPADAREAYERALAAHPSHAAAREALRRVYRLVEAWSPLRKLLESSLERTEGEAQVELLCELADVLAHSLGRPEAAREQLELALELAPDDPRPRRALQGLGIEQAQLTLPEFEDELPEGELPEPPELAESETPRGSRVVEVLERKLAACQARGDGDSPEAVRLRLRIAELRAGALGDPAGAAQMLEPLLDSDASLLDVAPALSGLYEQLDRQLELIVLCENAARLSEPREQRMYWYRRAADTARVVGEPERAISCYQELLAHHPDDHGARAALCDLFRSRGDRDSLRQLLSDEIVRAGESRELELRLELAELAGPGDYAEVLAQLRRCLEIEPRSEDVLDWALGVCEASGGGMAQLDLIEHVEALARGDRDRAALLARRGEVLADALDWQEEAAEAWRSSLELDPAQTLAKKRLAASL